MVHPIKIDAGAIYDDSALKQQMGISPTTLARSRRNGELRFTRKGGRVLYLGQWIQEWLTRDVEPASTREATATCV